MSAESPSILLVGRGFMPGSAFLERLCSEGCACTVAHSLADANAALRAAHFELVLSEMNFPEGSAYPLIALLEHSPTTLYFCVGVHDGCWWLPALSCGHRTWGQPALRPAEFAHELSEIIGESRLRATAAPASASAPNVIPMPRPAAVEASKPARLQSEKTKVRKTSA